MRNSVENRNAMAMRARNKGHLLELSNVSFSYSSDRSKVLNGIDLTVKAGQCVCLMGMNGCGKSTLIDCVLGECNIDEGEILLDGQNACSLSSKQRARIVSYVPQIHEQTFPYTVHHVVSMGLTAKSDSFLGGDINEDDELLVENALSVCGLEQFAERPSTALSGGEMQMVLLARALVQDAPLMLLDEPTAHLDFRNELLFLERLEWLVKKSNRAVLMATHSPNQAFHLEAAGVNVNVALMSNGVICSFGKPGDVLSEDALAEVFGVRGVVRKIEIAPDEQMSQIVALGSVLGNVGLD